MRHIPVSPALTRSKTASNAFIRGLLYTNNACIAEMKNQHPPENKINMINASRKLAIWKKTNTDNASTPAEIPTFNRLSPLLALSFTGSVTPSFSDANQRRGRAPINTCSPFVSFSSTEVSSNWLSRKRKTLSLARLVRIACYSLFILTISDIFQTESI